MDIKILIVLLAVAFFLFLAGLQKRRIILPTVVAFSIAAAWTMYYRYEYVGTNMFLFGAINVYPLVLWTCGLVTLHTADFRFTRFRSVLFPIVAYFTLLAVFEAVGYHLLDIHLASNYTSLLDLGVIHAPLVMKIFYIVVGPTYIITMRFLQKKTRELRR